MIRLFSLRHLCLLAALLIGLAAATFAQATQTSRIAWEFDRAVSEVATYTQAVTVDGTLRAEPVTCATRPGAVVGSMCTLSLPVLSSGPHTVKFDVTANAVGVEATVAIDTSKGPADPKNPKTSRQIVIVIP